MRDAFRIVAQNTLARFALLCGTSLCMRFEM